MGRGGARANHGRDSPFTCRGPSRGYGRARSHDPTVVLHVTPRSNLPSQGCGEEPTRPPPDASIPSRGDVWVPSPLPRLRGWGDPVKLESSDQSISTSWLGTQRAAMRRQHRHARAGFAAAAFAWFAVHAVLVRTAPRAAWRGKSVPRSRAPATTRRDLQLCAALASNSERNLVRCACCGARGRAWLAAAGHGRSRNARTRAPGCGVRSLVRLRDRVPVCCVCCGCPV